MRTIARTHRRILAGLRTDLTRATRHNGPNDTTGVPVLPQEAWAAYDTDHESPSTGRRRFAMLRELDPGNLYEVRVSGTLRFELRPAKPAPRPQATALGSMDIVVTRHCDAGADARLFIDGTEVTDSALNVYVVDRAGPTADSSAAADRARRNQAPTSVLDAIAAESTGYR